MGKKPLVAITLSIATGLVFGEIFSYTPLALSLFLFSLVLLESVLKQGRFLSLPLFLFGTAGFVVYQIVSTPFSSADLRRVVDQGPIRIIAQVDGPPRHHPEQVVLPMKAIAIHSDRALRQVNGSFRLTIHHADIPFKYGDQLDMEIRLRRPQQFQNPGAFQYADYRERQGESGVASLYRLDRVKKVGEGGNPLLKALYRCREKIRRQMIASMEGPPAALLMAWVIGESGYLTDEMRDVFSASGTTHILSISGSHLALVSLLVFGSTRWILLHLPAPLLLRISLWKIPSQWAALITAGPVTFYAFLTGGEIATLRSLMMILVYLFSIWIGRSGDVRVSLSLAALLILAFHPQAIFDLSFQLSFLSVLSISLTIEWWQRAFLSPSQEGETSLIQKYLLQPGRLMLLSTLGATLATAPLTLYYFHQFSWVGMVANLILIPFAGWVMVPSGLISAVLSLFLEEGFPAASWHQGLGSFYYWLTSFFSRLPGADLHFSSPSLITVILFYGVIFSLLVRQASWKRLLAVSIPFFALFLGWGAIRIPPENLRVTFLDVGQGDATLIEFPRGKTMLVDGGSGGHFNIGKVAVAPYLWERRIRRIDYMVGTHPQMDHMGGLTFLIQKFKIGEVWTNGMTRDVPFYHAFSESLQQKGLTPKAIRRGEIPMEIDRCQLRLLNPTEETPREREDFNNHSIVLHLSCPTPGEENISFLLAGDIEKKGEKMILEKENNLRSTVLKVPHHGSISSLDPPFLSAVSPQIALFSVGRDNPYRHPHPEVVAAYETLHARTYRTDQDGALMIKAGQMTGRSSGPLIESYREKAVKKMNWNSSLFTQEWENIKKALSPF